MELTDDIGELVAAEPGQVAVYARNLTTGAVVDVGADRVMPTESAAKTFMLITYCQLVANGTCDPAAPVVVPDNFQLPGTGVLRYLRPGITLSLEDLAWLMVIVSDNVATALLLLELGGPEPVNNAMSALGLTTAHLNSFEEMAAGVGFASSSPRHLAEAYTHLDDRRAEAVPPAGPQWTPRGLHHNACDGRGCRSRCASTTRRVPATGTSWMPAGLRPRDRGRRRHSPAETSFTSCPDDDAPVFAELSGQANLRRLVSI
jgi:hypothetical protein